MNLLIAATFTLMSPLTPGKLAPLHVEGVHVVRSDGSPVLLRGVNAASLEWTSDGENGHILETVRRAVGDWHANIVRVPLSQDRWFGQGKEQDDGGSAYRELVGKVVKTINGAGAYALMDLHWSDEGIWGNAIGQHLMPDKNSLTFWRDFARLYRNQSGVLFDLYNEPHDVSWEVWQHGGQVTERGQRGGPSRTYQAIGMQQMLDTVRSSGANNLVVAGGLDWAYDLSGFLAGRQLSDPGGNGVIYANHWYPFKGDTLDQWLAKIRKVEHKIPIIVSEFGAEGRATRGQDPKQWVARTLDILRDHRLSWIAWDLHPAAGPKLISDWNYTPTPTFGALVKEAISRP